MIDLLDFFNNKIPDQVPGKTRDLGWGKFFLTGPGPGIAPGLPHIFCRGREQPGVPILAGAGTGAGAPVEYC